MFGPTVLQKQWPVVCPTDLDELEGPQWLTGHHCVCQVNIRN